MNKHIYENECYNTPYQSNGAFLVLYKSSRKNAQCKVISVHHLISKVTPDRKVCDAKITEYFINILSECFSYCKIYKHIEIKSTVDYFKNCIYMNANNYFYHCNKSILYVFERKELHSFEQLINELYNVFSLVYPYNTITLPELYNNSSIKYYLNQWYN